MLYAPFSFSMSPTYFLDHRPDAQSRFFFFFSWTVSLIKSNTNTNIWPLFYIFASSVVLAVEEPVPFQI